MTTSSKNLAKGGAAVALSATIAYLAFQKDGPTITLAWDNAPSAATNWETGLMATTNFTDWYEVYRAPYQEHVVVTLPKDKPSEFFQAFNAVKAKK